VVRADVGVAGGCVVELSESISSAAGETIDATGLHVFPGLIDPHVHFNEPGRTDWEGVATGSSALAAGGGTCFFDMPLNSTPPVLDGEAFDRKLEACRAKSFTDFGIWGGITPSNLDTMEELADRGVVGFKAFMSGSGIDDFGRADDLTLWRGMKKAAELGLIVSVHAESEELTSRLTAEARAAGKTGVRDYLATRPIVAEVDAIRRAILFARETGCSLHVVHISSVAGGIEVVQSRHPSNDPRTPRADVTGETCAHYLAFDETDVERIGARAKCAPPIRSRVEVEAMWRQLSDGAFEWVASDHSPAPASMKTSNDFFDIWGGVAGIQSTLAVLLSRDPALPLERIAELIAGGAARRFGLVGKGSVALHAEANLVFVDLARDYVLTRDMLLDRHKLSPYVGRTFRGTVVRTMLRGRTIFQDGRVVGATTGRLVTPTRHPRG